MIRLTDILNEISNTKAPYGVLFLDSNKILVGDNHKDAIQLSKDIHNKILNVARQYGYYGEGIGIEYNKGIIKSDIYKALKNNSAEYKGSWDNKIEIPDTEKYTYIATLFSNPTENNRVPKLMNKVKDGETIFNLLARTFDDWTQQGLNLTSADLKRFLQEMSENGIDFYKWAQRPATQSNIQSFIDAGEKLMWPDNWEDYPNKAGKLARRETMIRDRWLIDKAPAGVYFIGNGHLKDISKTAGKGIIDGNLID
jgi:hypothetical protein